MKKIVFILVFAFVLASCGAPENALDNESKEENISQNREEIMAVETKKQNVRTIYLAGGCFWGVEGYFQKIDGVVDTDTGYANGKTEDTDYHALHSTDHAETVRVDYDFSIISLEEILLHYFRIIDPKSVNKQGPDRGRQYRTGVYYVDESDLPSIKKIFEYEEEKHGEIVVELEELKNFVTAEAYHQDYLQKNPGGYCHINLSMAYEPLFKGGYENPEEEEIKKLIDEKSYKVLRNNGTEPPNTSDILKEYRKGIYVDKITGEPLFASKDKFDSHCGWPSFSKPILNNKIKYLNDDSLGMNRVEVRSSGGDNHLGHVFNDGPIEKGGLRYCINGLSLRFIPYEDMDKEGYTNVAS